MTTQDAAGPAARFCAPKRRVTMPVRSAASARERISDRLDERLNDPSRRAPRAFLHVISRIHRLLPRILRGRVPVTFIGYALINGSAFLIDISFLWLFFDKLHWFSLFDCLLVSILVSSSRYSPYRLGPHKIQRLVNY